MDQKIKLLLSSFGDHRIKLDEQLKFHTLSQLPATTQAFFVATNRNELLESISAAYDLKIPTIILGSGTKINFTSAKFEGLVIKNRSDNLKIGAVRGKVGRGGIGVEEAMVEADSGVSLSRLNEFLVKQNLQPINFNSNPLATLGGALWSDFSLQFYIETITIWHKGEVEEINLKQLDKLNQVILSVILKIKSKN